MKDKQDKLSKFLDTVEYILSIVILALFLVLTIGISVTYVITGNVPAWIERLGIVLLIWFLFLDMILLVIWLFKD